MKSISLYDYQEQCLTEISAGWRSKHKNQLLYGCCSFGKTEIALEIMRRAAENGWRTAMIMDRKILVNQTSIRADSYSIDHGVAMAGHWRYHTYKSIQLCSAQTLEAKGAFPANIRLMIYDECHVKRSFITEFIKNNPNVWVLGLSGSPFTKGLGSIYSRVVSAVTINELIERNRLTPLRVFIAKEIDMNGAKKTAGEWQASEAGKRGVKIVGDIVSTWIEKTYDLYGGPVKTILFAPDVATGQLYAQRFQEAGYNFKSISYKEDDNDIWIEEFSKTDSKVLGLIATDILTKGFSCILEGSMVITDKGLVEIEKVTSFHKLWNGVEYVPCKGAIFKGVKNVITYAGLTATADHRVKTKKGWRTFGECAKKQIPIITTGDCGNAIQITENYLTGIEASLWKDKMEQYKFLSMHMRKLWSDDRNFLESFAFKNMEWMLKLQKKAKNPVMALQKSLRNAAKMSKQKSRIIQKLWRSWNTVQFQFINGCCNLDSGEYWNSRKFQRNGAGSNRQQRELSAWKYSMGNKILKCITYPTRRMGCSDASIQNKSSWNKIFGQDIKKSIQSWIYARNDNTEVSQALRQTKGRVWDILGAENGNCFTCNGLLVHNCDDVMIGISARPFTKSFSSHVQQLGRLQRTFEGKEFGCWIDHSGNFLRFLDQWEDLCENGVQELDDGAEKPKPEPSKAEKEAAKCPKCGQLWGRTDTCQSCGEVRIRKSKVEEIGGKAEELITKKTKKEKSEVSQDEKNEFYAELLGYAEHFGKNPGAAWHQYRAKYGVNYSGKKPDPLYPSQKTINFVKKCNIAYAKAMAK